MIFVKMQTIFLMVAGLVPTELWELEKVIRVMRMAVLVVKSEVFVFGMVKLAGRLVEY